MIKILQQYQYPILYPLRHEDFVHSKWTKRGSNKNKLQEPPLLIFEKMDDQNTGK